MKIATSLKLWLIFVAFLFAAASIRADDKDKDFKKFAEEIKKELDEEFEKENPPQDDIEKCESCETWEHDNKGLL